MWNTYADYLLSRYRNTGVLVDSNLLLLYFVGMYDQGLIERWSRTGDRFVSADFGDLYRLLEQFQRLVVTPHVLTEVSNHLDDLREPARTRCLEWLAQVIRSAMHEKRTPGTTLSENPAFNLFGIADASISDAASDSYLVLTDDLDLYGYLQRLDIDVLNFNEIRTLAD